MDIRSNMKKTRTKIKQRPMKCRVCGRKPRIVNLGKQGFSVACEQDTHTITTSGAIKNIAVSRWNDINSQFHPTYYSDSRQHFRPLRRTRRRTLSTRR